MKRNVLNFLVDLASALVLLGLIATGLVIRLVLPPGSGRARVLWTADRHEWGDWHFWLAALAGAMVLVHVALHWQWICVTTVRLFRRGSGEPGYPSPIGRNLAGTTLVLCLIGLFTGYVWLARANVKAIGEGGGRRGQGESAQVGQGGHDSENDRQSIRGSMTLGEAAAANGMSAERLRTELGLPESVSADERLGQLRQQYGFTMGQVREIVAADQAEEGGSSHK